ncbi:UNVERIFIED_CONTAM: hypothetical protein NCL1_27587 [Trichonephila clavipes]
MSRYVAKFVEGEVYYSPPIEFLSTMEHDQSTRKRPAGSRLSSTGEDEYKFTWVMDSSYRAIQKQGRAIVEQRSNDSNLQRLEAISVRSRVWSWSRARGRYVTSLSPRVIEDPLSRVANAHQSPDFVMVRQFGEGILMFLKKLPDFSRSLVVPLLEGVLRNYNESLFSYRTAQELLFDGYKVDLIQDLIDLASAFVTVPEILPNNTFGFLYGET